MYSLGHQRALSEFWFNFSPFSFFLFSLMLCSVSDATWLLATPANVGLEKLEGLWSIEPVGLML